MVARTETNYLVRKEAAHCHIVRKLQTCKRDVGSPPQEWVKFCEGSFIP